MDVVHRDSTDVKIEAFPPGHYETYNILPRGKAVFHERKRFHKIGDQPLYKTLSPTLGNYNQNNYLLPMLLEHIIV